MEMYWCGCARQPNAEVVTVTHTQQAKQQSNWSAEQQQGDNQAAAGVSSAQPPFTRYDSSQVLSPINVKDLDHTTPPTWSPSAGWESGKKSSRVIKYTWKRQLSLKGDVKGDAVCKAMGLKLADGPRGGCVVSSVWSTGEAAQNGIRPGLVVASVNGADVRWARSQEVSTVLRNVLPPVTIEFNDPRV